MNKFRTITMYFVLVLVTLVLLFGINRIENRLDSQVAEHNLRFTGQIKNAPPVVVFTTVALGSFRGLVADLLWLRAGALQEKGNYFEMVQLARWITDQADSRPGDRVQPGGSGPVQGAGLDFPAQARQHHGRRESVLQESAGDPDDRHCRR